MEFDGALFLEALPRLARAVVVNLQIAAAIIALAVVGATALTVLRAWKRRAVNGAIGFLISFIRGTPLLIQIFLCYYALPAVGLNLSPVAAGILAISLNSTVFLSEAMRGSLGTLDPGQIEAATALALPPRAIWLRVVLPQLFRRILPVLIAEFTIIVKGTALLSVITVVEVLRTAQQMAAATFHPFENLLAAALVFLVVNLTIGGTGQAMEARLAAGRA
jgi:His/Glu/Gln/Arg/opine family amino acid ABC transporter permease subunit